MNLGLAIHVLPVITVSGPKCTISPMGEELASAGRGGEGSEGIAAVGSVRVSVGGTGRDSSSSERETTHQYQNTRVFQ